MEPQGDMFNDMQKSVRTNIYIYIYIWTFSAYVYLYIVRIMFLQKVQTVHVLTRVLFLCIFPELGCNEANKHENSIQVNA